MDCIYSGRGSPLGIEPYLRDLLTHPLPVILGLSGCAEDLSAPERSQLRVKTVPQFF